VAMVQSALLHGLMMFQLHVPSRMIRKENFRHIKTCYICYQLDDHLSSGCPRRNSNYKICSTCATVGHTWRECAAVLKKCINCDGPHSAMAAECTKRRELMKVSPSIPEKSSNYANKSAVTVPSVQLDSSTVSKTVSCIFLALVAADDGSSFQDKLNNLLGYNDLSPINVGNMRFELPHPTHHNSPPKCVNGAQVENNSDIDLNKKQNSDKSTNMRAGENREFASSPEDTDRKKITRPIIKIFRREDFVREINKKNLQKLVNEAKVMVTSDDLTEVAAVEYLTDRNSDSAQYFRGVLALPVELFNKKLNAGVMVNRNRAVTGTLPKKTVLRSFNSSQ